MGSQSDFSCMLRIERARNAIDPHGLVKDASILHRGRNYNGGAYESNCVLELKPTDLQLPRAGPHDRPAFPPHGRDAINSIDRIDSIDHAASQALSDGPIIRILRPRVSIAVSDACKSEQFNAGHVRFFKTLQRFYKPHTRAQGSNRVLFAAAFDTQAIEIG